MSKTIKNILKVLSMLLNNEVTLKEAFAGIVFLVLGLLFA